MIVDLTPLYFHKDIVQIDDVLYFSKDDLDGTELLDLRGVSVKGDISVSSQDEYILSLKIEGVMVLPCARTLKPVDYHFETEIEQNILENSGKFQKTIDILPIIWENILLEIPIRVISPDANDMEWESIIDDD